MRLATGVLECIDIANLPRDILLLKGLDDYYGVVTTFPAIERIGFIETDRRKKALAALKMANLQIRTPWSPTIPSNVYASRQTIGQFYS